MSFFSSSRSSHSTEDQAGPAVLRADESVATPPSGTRDTSTAGTSTREEEYSVREESSRRLVPTYMGTEPQPLMTVRWDHATPASISPERQLQLMDAEMRRLARQADQTWTDGNAGFYRRPDPVAMRTVMPAYHSAETHRLSNLRPPPPLASYRDEELVPRVSSLRQPLPLSYRDAEMDRMWSQLALANRELETKRLADVDREFSGLWNRAAYQNAAEMAPFPGFEAPPGFVKLTSASGGGGGSSGGGGGSMLVPRFQSQPWGEGAHAQSWRTKEDFHLANPVVRGRDGRQEFRLEFDLRQFLPHEVEVTTQSGTLTVQARHQDAGDGRQVRREYYRQCSIPPDVDPAAIVSHLSRSGILAVHAPFAAQPDRDGQNIPVKNN